LVALNEPTVLAPSRDVPPTEVVVSRPVVLTAPTPVSLNMPVDLRVTGPPTADIVPVTVSAPALSIMTLPPPLWDMPVTVSGAAVLVNWTLPDVVFVALNVPTVLAPFNTVPPTDVVVRVPLVLNAPVSVMAPEASRLIAAPPVVETRPLMLIVPAPTPPIVDRFIGVAPTEMPPAPIVMLPPSVVVKATIPLPDVVIAAAPVEILPPFPDVADKLPLPSVIPLMAIGPPILAPTEKLPLNVPLVDTTLLATGFAPYNETLPEFVVEAVVILPIEMLLPITVMLPPLELAAPVPAVLIRPIVIGPPPVPAASTATARTLPPLAPLKLVPVLIVTLEKLMEPPKPDTGPRSNTPPMGAVLLGFWPDLGMGV